MNRGEKFELTRVFQQDDYDRFARLTGDDNPIHVDPEFAKTTRFGRTLCHGMLLFSTLSGAIASAVPGAEVELENIELMFPGPTFTGDAMKIALEVLEVDRDSEGGERAELSATILAPDGSPSCTARARVRKEVFA